MMALGTEMVISERNPGQNEGEDFSFRIFERPVEGSLH